MKITEIDKNFSVETIEGKNIKFYDAKSKPFVLYGLTFENDCYVRIPSNIHISNGVDQLAKNTSGGRIRFCSNTRYLAIKTIQTPFDLPQMADTGTSGFDVNVVDEGKTYTRVFQMPYGYKGGNYECIIDLHNENNKNITINFPLYTGVNELLIGVDENSNNNEGKEYKYNDPIVFYGSSITQGACASRPSSSFVNMISNSLNVDVLNLGFSGSCKGEIKMAEYISQLNMKALVIEYDHNSNVDDLKNNHLSFYYLIRSRNPKLPIIIMSRTDYSDKEEDKERRQIIIDTIDFAKKNNDKNVCFIDGKDIFKEYGSDYCSVDGTHPNDLGMYIICKKIKDALGGML